MIGLFHFRQGPEGRRVSSSGSALSFKGVVALAGQFPVLAGVDLELPRGETILLRGANGAGKTSLMRVCLGLLPVVSGQARVLGFDVNHQKVAIRKNAFLLGHQSGLYDDLTVVENLRFALKAARKPLDEIGRTMELLQLSGRLGDTRIGQLSAGQRKRVGLAVLVARQPELWLLDEPHASLDALSRQVLGQVINDAVTRGSTVVMASHEHDAALPRVDRIVFMAGGKVDHVEVIKEEASLPSTQPRAGIHDDPSIPLSPDIGESNTDTSSEAGGSGSAHVA